VFGFGLMADKGDLRMKEPAASCMKARAKILRKTTETIKSHQQGMKENLDT